MSVLSNGILLDGVAAPTGYNLTKSVRLRAAADAGFTKTFASSGSRTKQTFSFWAKFDYNAGAGYREFIYETTATYNFVNLYQYQGKLSYFGRDLVTGNIINYTLSTDAVFRDPSAWYHIVYAIDYTQATAANRVKIYVNGVQYSLTATNDGFPPQNWNGYLNVGGYATLIGRSGGGDNYDGYLAEMNFIDGQQLTPSDFGETDSITGVWKPKAFTGTYGTNGFYLPFTDVATTSGSNAGLGKDFSGNGNYWNTTNISVTAGVTYDSMKDVPTLTDENSSNYSTLNPLSRTTGTVSDGNLKFVGAASANGDRINGTLAVNSGKWYYEVNILNAPLSPRSETSWYHAFGFGLSTFFGANTSPRLTTDTLNYQDSGYVKNGSSANTDTGSAVANGDVLSVAVDLDANTYTFYKNNTSVASGTIGIAAGTLLVPMIVSYNGDYGTMAANFGQRPFAYTPPSGFKALNTYNLPNSTIVAGSAHFNPVLWSGSGTDQTITGVGFRPDFIWIKNRNAAGGHRLHDILRPLDNTIKTHVSDAEGTESGLNFTIEDDGFSVDGNRGDWNFSGRTYVGWNWKANGAGSSNTAGSITSSVSVNASAGFSIVTYTGTGSNATVGHGLGVAPKFIAIKNRTNSYSWRNYHASIGSGSYVYFNSIDGSTSSSSTFNNTSPTSSVFSVGTEVNTNASGESFIAYCWSEVAGYSKFGSYTGNGSTDGVFIYTGFRPKYFMIKSLQLGDYTHWSIRDSVRSPSNIASQQLYANFAYGEDNEITEYIDLLSNGVKLRGNLDGINKNGNTYIYIAFAENPFKNSLAR